ncbi:MAG: murein hydrolase activator EnvC family protein [Egibacteraceae bacterium]
MLLCAVAGPAAASPEERRAADSRAKVSAVLAELERARVDRAGRAAALADAARSFAVVMNAVGAAELAVQRQQVAVEQAQAELAALEALVDDQRQALAARAERLYKQGTTGSLTILLEAADPADALRRSAYAEAISRTERRTWEGVEVARTAVDAQRRKLRAEQASLRRVVADQRALLVEVAEIREDRAIALIAADQRLALIEGHLEAENRQVIAITRRSSVEELSSDVASAALDIAAGAASAVGAVGAVGGDGWIWPARGPVTSGFGFRWGRMHQGVDIGASTGAAIVAARSGVVRYAGTMSGYGRVVILDHGGGLSTLYAHQSAIAVDRGEQVGQGQRIGSVGCSGRCTGPHLHFEVRVNGAPRNPRNYL